MDAQTNLANRCVQQRQSAGGSSGTLGEGILDTKDESGLGWCYVTYCDVDLPAKRPLNRRSEGTPVRKHRYMVAAHCQCAAVARMLTESGTELLYRQPRQRLEIASGLWV